jgi:hypothetical protein
MFWFFCADSRIEIGQPFLAVQYTTTVEGRGIRFTKWFLMNVGERRRNRNVESKKAYETENAHFCRYGDVPSPKRSFGCP